jgi:hypothetical protein
VDLAYRYGDGPSLYLNVTNRCTNRCWFCVRHRCEGLDGAVLRGDAEPVLADLLAAVEAHGGDRGGRLVRVRRADLPARPDRRRESLVHPSD